MSKVKGEYASGKGRCPICLKFLNPYGKEVRRSKGGMPYHKAIHCKPKDGHLVGPPRLRFRQRSRNARIKRQAKATYY